MTRKGASNAEPKTGGLGLMWQFSAVLLAALLSTHLIVMALLQSRSDIIHPISREQVLSTLSAAYALAAYGDDQVASVQALNAWTMQAGNAVEHSHDADQVPHLWIAAQPSVAEESMQPIEQELSKAMRQRFGLQGAAAARMQLERVNGENAKATLFSTAAWQPLRLCASIALPNGQWLNANIGVQGRYEWARVLSYIIPASVLPVLLVAMLFASRLVRPLRRLIEATGKVRYGSVTELLPVQGPREARELTEQFNAMQQRLDSHRDQRTRMLAAISHDLRTPLTVLRIQVELIEDEVLREDLIVSLTELQAMVEATLDYARADARSEPFQTVDVVQMLVRLVQRHAQLGQLVEVSAPASVLWRCRPLALQRALANLIENAFYYAGDASVSIGINAEGALNITVQDSGPGIDPAQLERMLEPFEQMDASRGPERKGLGLGLSIARTCIDMQGGQLELSNRPEGGLRVQIVLPPHLAE